MNLADQTVNKSMREFTADKLVREAHQVEPTGYTIKTSHRGVQFTIGEQTFTLDGTQPDPEEPERQQFFVDMLKLALNKIAATTPKAPCRMLTEAELWEIEAKSSIPSRRPVSQVNGFTGEDETVWEQTQQFSFLMFAGLVTHKFAEVNHLELKDAP